MISPIPLLLTRFSQFSERSKESIVNILLSFGAKGFSIFAQLLIVPLTINYINPTQYGIWLTLSSIIGWISFFDLGLGNGMRNKFAEAKAREDIELAKQYVSTTYFTIGVIVLGLLVVIQIINLFISWPSILNVDASYKEELRLVFAVLTVFFCVNMVVRLFKSLLTADQKPGIVSWIDVCGQLFSLGAIYLLTKVSRGSLIKLASYYSGIPTITVLLVSAYAFRFTPYKHYSPRISMFRKSLVKDIMNVGVQFFIIYLCMIIVFQVINIVISRVLGPDAVTEFNIANKYFGIASSVLIIILTPFWSAFTDAYNKNDNRWMRRVKTSLEIVWLIELVVIIIMFIIAPWFYGIWIGDSVSIQSSLSLVMAFFIISQSLGAVYMNLINGIGTIRIQLIVYVVFAVISWPLMMFSCKRYGLVGVLFVPSMVYIVQAVLGKIQLERILKGTAKGIWNK